MGTHPKRAVLSTKKGTRSSSRTVRQFINLTEYLEPKERAKDLVKQKPSSLSGAEDAEAAAPKEEADDSVLDGDANAWSSARHDALLHYQESASTAVRCLPRTSPASAPDLAPRPRNGLIDLGYAVQKSRDTLECMNSSLEAQLSPDNYAQLGLKRAFGELGEAFAKDAKAMSSGSFDRGVSHGKWLAGVAPEKEEAMAQLAETLRIEHFRLQQQYKQLHVQSQTQIATIAHLEQIQLTHPQLPPVPVALSQESISRYQDDCDLTQMLEDIQPLGAVDGDFSGLLTDWAQGVVNDHRAAMLS